MIGIAIGAGTHIAISTADMVLIRNNLFDIVIALDLAKLVFNRIKLNFLFATIYNIIAIPLAAGLSYPWTHMSVPPSYAGLAMAMSSISVVLSSMSLHLYKRPKMKSINILNRKMKSYKVRHNMDNENMFETKVIMNNNNINNNNNNNNKLKKKNLGFRIIEEAKK